MRCEDNALTFLHSRGHYQIEGNKPATFKVSTGRASRIWIDEQLAYDFEPCFCGISKYPVFSFLGDLRMLWEVVTLQRSV